MRAVQADVPGETIRAAAPQISPKWHFGHASITDLGPKLVIVLAACHICGNSSITVVFNQSIVITVVFGDAIFRYQEYPIMAVAKSKAILKRFEELRILAARMDKSTP
ncbi:predicted protein [Sclerotinia sclerotiorum 1980 UF-70]|uniref:Uncharacterized protein n=2 Tax=Sclerotinia sclerotiorum (strain ATCC 18683 / 1980 / Ss-1) TaxID=665079 RepID=A7EJR7_SCLS1|nr:predicted protein [Sclerotinia sclerotiorum 1980 UF-70]APA11997.1 hypothetical protein sscle_08g067670 [Sclerotinia sclerotiorum 1980 UF-70]EDO03083.1 predicted protein [Sclerotinia sclerotiorum 1980 UF-70]